MHWSDIIRKAFFLQQIRTNIETHSHTLYRKRETLEHSAIKEISPSNPSIQSLRNPIGEEAERIQKPEIVEDI